MSVFNIDELNGDSNLDFSDLKEWLNVEINSIKFSLTDLNECGEFKDSYQSLMEIKKSNF